MFREYVRLSRKWLVGAGTKKAESHYEQRAISKINGPPTITANEKRLIAKIRSSLRLEQSCECESGWSLVPKEY